MYLGYTLAACTALGRSLWPMWLEASAAGTAPRVAVQFFTCEVLLRQLNAFTASKVELAHFPDLFVWDLRYAVLSLVGQFLEGRHRHIKHNKQNKHIKI